MAKITNSKLFMKYRMAHNGLHYRHQVVLPGHRDIEVNEIADGLSSGECRIDVEEKADG